MKCPKCQTDLMISDRQGIEIDFCPQCRGVWLDRGELDKIIDRASGEGGRPPAQEMRRERSDRPPVYHKKKKNWLGGGRTSRRWRHSTCVGIPVCSSSKCCRQMKAATSSSCVRARQRRWSS